MKHPTLKGLPRAGTSKILKIQHESRSKNTAFPP